MSKHMKSPIDIEAFDSSFFKNETDEVFALPPQCFASKEFFEFEMNAVWKKEWFCIGHESDIKNTGDYYTFQIGNDPLVVIRDRSGSVNVLSNVCQHRSMLIMEGRGNTRRMRCPLHAWVYNTSGELVSAPGLTDVEGSTFNVKDVCLPKIRTEIWEGFIFICLNEETPSLAARLGDLSQKLANYNMKNLRASDPLVLEEFNWNWKIFNDECYHCVYLHANSWGDMYHTAPEVVDETVDFNDVESGIVSYRLVSQFKDAAPTHTGKILQPHIEGLTDEERSQLTYITVAPNLLIVAMPDKVKYFLWLPVSENKSLYGVSWMYPESTLDLPSYKENFDKEHDDLYPVMKEDLFAWSRSQQGMESQFATRGRLTNSELVIKRLQNWLIDKYRKEDSAAKSEAV